MTHDNKPYKVITKEVVVEKYKEFLRMNYRNQANLNPKVVKHLRSTTPGLFSHVELGDLGTVGAEAAIGVTTEENPDRIEVKWSSSQTTAAISLTRLVTKYPPLRVERGYLRKFPVSLRSEGGVSFLALDLKGSTVEPVEKRKKKTDSEAASTATKTKGAPGDEAKKKSETGDEAKKKSEAGDETEKKAAAVGEAENQVAASDETKE